MLTTLRMINENEKPLLWELLSNYLQELSQFGEVNFDYPYFGSYWTNENRWPYFIINDENIVGFILVNTWSFSGRSTDFGLAEFFIRPEYRGLKIGKNAFRLLLNLHPGQWELSVMQGNETAKQFWKRSIFSSDLQINETSEKAVIFRFSTT